MLVDTSRLNRIVEINAEDMYVTVEPGVTWHDLWQALKAKGLRTSFWGPFSGLKATVGGSASQNSASLGSGNYGISADAILGFEIVLASGEILRTGSHAAANGTPFFRWYGPDLTGLFCGDAGALGIKASITLRLIKEPPFFGAASFGFATFEQMAAGIAAAARENVVADNFGVDPKLQQGQLSKASSKDAVAAAMAVARSARNPFEAAGAARQDGHRGQALPRRPQLFGAFHRRGRVEGRDRRKARGTAQGAERPRRGDRQYDSDRAPGDALPAAVPDARAEGRALGAPARGHAVLEGEGVSRPADTPLCRQRRAHEAGTRWTRAACSWRSTGTAFLYEPVFYWEDDRTVFHKRYLPADYLKTLPEYPANPDGRALVHELRAEIRKLFASVGAIHMQVGKSYPYMEGRQAEAARALRELKKVLDPQGLMNPGALQL